MTQKQIHRIIKLLKEKNVSFDKGLTSNEVDKLEQIFLITFPKDLKLFLQTEIPTSSGFVNWRYGINSKNGRKEIENWINIPKDGILFDIKNNGFWIEKWGEKPTNFQHQKEVAFNKIAQQPKLIPIYSHRFIPSEPNEIGNPIFSVYQTDIIYYGFDLIDYFSKEFQIKIPISYGTISEPKIIPFWSDFDS